MRGCACACGLCANWSTQDFNNYRRVACDPKSTRVAWLTPAPSSHVPHTQLPSRLRRIQVCRSASVCLPKPSTVCSPVPTGTRLVLSLSVSKKLDIEFELRLSLS